jgi:O-antigen ligase
MVYNFITYLKKSNLNKVGTLFFRIGIFLLPSAFFISAILFLLSIGISFFNNSSRLFNDKWNYLFYISFIFMIISSLIHLINFPNDLLFYLLKTNPEDVVIGTEKLKWSSWESLIGLGNWVPFIFCFVGFQSYLSSPRERKISAKLLITGSLPVLVTGFGQFWFGWYGPMYFLNDLIIWFQRPLLENQGLSGLFNNQNYAGCWLTIIWPFSLALIFDKTSNIFNKTIIIAIGMAISVATFLTYSRSAWGGFLLSSFLLLGENIFVILIFSTILIIFSAFLLPSIISQDIFNINSNFLDKFNILQQFDPSEYQKDSQRLTIFSFALKYISLRPLIGWGSSVFFLYYFANKHLYTGHPHNLFLEVAFSYGLLSAIPLFINILFLTFSAFKEIFQNNSKRTNLETYFEKAWWISFFVLLCTQMVDIQYFDGRISLAFWILLAGIKQIINNDLYAKLNK